MSPNLAEIAALFLKLGLIAFGGPAAHVALMRREVVERRHWLDEPAFFDYFGTGSCKYHLRSFVGQFVQAN